MSLLSGDLAAVQALLHAGANLHALTQPTAPGAVPLGAKALVAYRQGRAHAWPRGKPERAAEFALCDALDRLLDALGVGASLQDTMWWMTGCATPSRSPRARGGRGGCSPFPRASG